MSLLQCRARDSWLRSSPFCCPGRCTFGFARPARRALRKIYADASVRLVLTCQHDASAWSDDISHLTWQQAIEAEPLADQAACAPTQPAYVSIPPGRPARRKAWSFLTVQR